ncbi:MAG: homoserine O-acetyltransferase [Bacteroidetes bacterium]|nr:homoserine O-acetyltransferase [Bacteroidota bacterium]
MKKDLYKFPTTFRLESGKQIQGLELAYHTAGSLHKNSKVVWICHGLTANSNPEEWWTDLVGEGKLFNSQHYFLICVNIPGSCYGSTGPLSINPETGSPYYTSFPEFTITDIIRSFDHLRKHLGIEKIHTLVGASIGGCQVLEWAVQSPTLIEHAIAIACSAKTSPWAAAFNESQRMAIFSDSSYYENHPKGGLEGLKTARSIALLSYRNSTIYNKAQQSTGEHFLDQKVFSYQRYQGEKLSKRFNAYSYVALSRSLDSQDLGRTTHSITRSLSKIRAKTLIIAIKTDLLFTLEEHEYLHKHIPNSRLRVINSTYGHDGFLIESTRISQLIQEFYNRKSTFYPNLRKAI